MKKISLIAGIASLATVTAVLWSLPAAASPTGAIAAHNKIPLRDRQVTKNDADCDSDDPCDGTGVPEPGSLALLALGLGGIGAYTITRRRRVKAK